MDIVKVLKRKDASSVVVAVVLGIILNQAVESFSERPADWLSGATSSGGGWRSGLWEPLVLLIVELVVLSLLIKVYTALVSSQSGGKK